jgi:hypothetical protein
MAQLLRSGVAMIPQFRELKIYYNYVLNRQEYQELGYLSPIKHTVWGTLTRRPIAHAP